MHNKYSATVAQLAAWAQSDDRVHAALILGSQVREEFPGDEWSDLDILLLVDEPQAFLQDAAWLANFGELVCATLEETPLPWINLTWAVKRALFTDHRALDFSILPDARRDDVLAINAEVHANGFQVIYAGGPGELAAKNETRLAAQNETELAAQDKTELEAKIAATLATVAVTPPRPPSLDELQRTVQGLLFQLIYACKKVKRGELWVAVSCLDQPVSLQLLRLIEFYLASSGAAAPRIRYEGRLLEQRLPPELREALGRCFARYDAADAVRTAGHLIEFSCRLAGAICERNGYPFDRTPCDRARKLYREMFGEDQDADGT